jgi:hypothetical protein
MAVAAFSAKIKNGGVIPPQPHTSSCFFASLLSSIAVLLAVTLMRLQQQLISQLYLTVALGGSSCEALVCY